VKTGVNGLSANWEFDCGFGGLDLDWILLLLKRRNQSNGIDGGEAVRKMRREEGICRRANKMLAREGGKTDL
jgi:hypothetical protein